MGLVRLHFFNNFLIDYGKLHFFVACTRPIGQAQLTSIRPRPGQATLRPGLPGLLGTLDGLQGIQEPAPPSLRRPGARGYLLCYVIYYEDIHNLKTVTNRPDISLSPSTASHHSLQTMSKIKLFCILKGLSTEPLLLLSISTNTSAT